MMPAAKHGDPQLGVDIHLCVVPPSPSPVPLPTPHISVVFDPFDYIPYIGATVTVCGMKRATAGTNGIVVHIPPGFPFAPKLPDKDDELFMGSSTVVADGDPFSFIGVPVLGCQVAGMISIPRLKKKGSGKKAMLLPTTFNLAIPTTVFVGGPPTISLMGLAFKGAFAALGKFAKSGLFKRIRQKLFKNLNPGFLKCKILRAEPVNILTGEVMVEQEDFTLQGRIPIEWVRSYASGNGRKGACGYGWETPADTRLEVDPIDGTVSLRHPTVGPLFFARLPETTGDEACEIELMDGARLSDHGDEFRVRTKEDSIYHFPKALATVGQLGATEYPVGRVADLCGNWLEFERRGGRVTAIVESAGRRLEILSDQRRIKEIALTVPGNDVRHVFVRYEYDAAGDLVAVMDATGQPYRFAYDAHHLVRHTDRRGLSFYYEYDTAAPNGWRVVHSWGDGGLYGYRFAYDDVLRERRITDSLGHVSLVTLDARALPISETDALGGRTVFEYDEAGRTTCVVDPGGCRTSLAYDERGNLVDWTRPDDTHVRMEFDRHDKAISITDANGALWRQTWNPRGLLLEQHTPLQHTCRYEYDAGGRVSAVVNARGARTELAFDAFGNLVRYTDAMGARTRFEYDSRGNLIAKVDPLARVTRYDHDLKDRVTEARLPSGATVRCEYDAEDDLVLHVDENGNETRFEYVGLGEIGRRIGPDGSAVTYRYDSEERLLEVINQRGESYQLERDALGRIEREIDYWGQVRTYTYSPSGYIQRSVDPSGTEVHYATDPLGRIRSRTLPHRDGGVFEERFEYDANGKLVSCSNPDAWIRRSYDPEGRLLLEAQGDDFVVVNTYDEVGNRTARRTSLKAGQTVASHLVRYIHDLEDRPVAISVDEHPPMVIEHDAAGQVVAEQLSATVRRRVEYNVDGHLTRQMVRAGRDVIFDCAYAYDSAGNVTGWRDVDLGRDAFACDRAGRITAHADARGRVARYASDAAGDRMSTVVVQRPGVALRGGDANWSRISENEGGLHRFDRRGTLVERRDGTGTLRLMWDANERLVETRIDDSPPTRYRYDPLGRRIDKEGEGGRTGFFWDGDALVADARGPHGDSTARWRVREWVYGPESFEPLALIDGSDTASVYHYHRHPNGCPVRLTDGRGEVKWAATYDAWGVTSVLRNVVDNPIRFQGQYADEETGLFYNRHRYYSPSVGSFISQDPIGLFAGVNLYSYGPNPWAWVDPLGLNCAHLSNKAVAKRAKWVKARQGVEGPGLRGHFGKHGDQVGADSAKAFDRSARETISDGRRFTYRDRATGEPRVGYFNPATGLFTATSQTRKNPAILTHFPESWANLRKLPGFSTG